MIDSIEKQSPTIFKRKDSNQLSLNSSRAINQQMNSNFPSKEQWGLIYDHSAQESKFMQQLSRKQYHQQKKLVKQTLDKQVQDRNYYHSHEKQYDERYKQYINDKVRKQQQKQKAALMNRRLQRMQMQKVNKQLKYIKQKDKTNLQQQTIKKQLQNTGGLINIGYQSQVLRRQRIDNGKMSMNQYYDNQIRQREKQTNMLKSIDTEAYRRNDKYQQQQYQKRYPQSLENYGSNRVYSLYRELVDDQMSKKTYEQYKIRKQAEILREKQAKAEEEKQIQRDQQKKKVKQYLDFQVQTKNQKISEMNQLNPQKQVSYQLFKNLNREPQKRKPDLQLARFLDQQIQDQRMRNQKGKFMSDEEFKLNMPKLNKALNHNFNSPSHQDRSVLSIGEKVRRYQPPMKDVLSMQEQSNKSQINQNSNQQAVRNKIQALNNRRKYNLGLSNA